MAFKHFTYYIRFQKQPQEMWFETCISNLQNPPNPTQKKNPQISFVWLLEKMARIFVKTANGANLL